MHSFYDPNSLTITATCNNSTNNRANSSDAYPSGLCFLGEGQHRASNKERGFSPKEEKKPLVLVQLLLVGTGLNYLQTSLLHKSLDEQ